VVEKTGYIEIAIVGKRGSFDLSPDNYDIREIISMLESAEDLLFPVEKKDRPLISYLIEQGSVRHIFKTSIQHIIGFNALIGQISLNQSIDFLDLPTAKAIENIQEIAIRKAYSFSINTSVEKSNIIEISPDTRFFRTENYWGNAEFYLYGKIVNAGGKERANIHISTEELGTVRVETPISFLEKYEENLLYKRLGIRVTAKQHAETGEIDRSTLKFVELVDYDQVYDKAYLNALREKAKRSWLQKVSPDAWLREQRGGYDA
jgi:hypothetical protein